LNFSNSSHQPTFSFLYSPDNFFTQFLPENTPIRIIDFPKIYFSSIGLFSKKNVKLPILSVVVEVIEANDFSLDNALIFLLFLKVTRM